jgi:tetratricopeptide (TPR) repeat protein
MNRLHSCAQSQISDAAHWRKVLKQQRVNNARQWLARVAASQGAATVVLSDYDNLLRALEVCLKEPETFDLAYELIQALYQPAVGFADWERWLVYVQNALALCRSPDRRLEEARLLEQAADLMRLSGQLAGTESYYLGSLHLFKRAEEATDHVRVVSKLAGFYVAQGRAGDSIALCHRTLAAEQQMRDQLDVGRIWLALAEAHMSLDEWREGLFYAEKACELFLQADDKRMTTEALLTIVGARAQLGSWQEAERAAADLTTRLLALQDERTLLRLKLNLGVLAFSQKDYYRAEAVWQEALQMQSQTGYEEFEAQLCNNLGKVYTQLGEWPPAREMLLRSLALFDGAGYSWANTMDNLADLYEAMGDLAACAETLAAAVARLEGQDHSAGLDQLLPEMKKRLQQLGATHT